MKKRVKHLETYAKGLDTDIEGLDIAVESLLRLVSSMGDRLMELERAVEELQNGGGSVDGVEQHVFGVSPTVGGVLYTCTCGGWSIDTPKGAGFMSDIVESYVAHRKLVWVAA